MLDLTRSPSPLFPPCSLYSLLSLTFRSLSLLLAMAICIYTQGHLPVLLPTGRRSELLLLTSPMCSGEPCRNTKQAPNVQPPWPPQAPTARCRVITGNGFPMAGSGHPRPPRRTRLCTSSHASVEIRPCVPAVATENFASVLQSSGSVQSVRICSTTLARLLHGFVLLPSGISCKMIISLDNITIIAMLVVSFLSMSRYLPLVV